MYEPGYKPNEEFTFYNTRSYKNWDHGIFIHGVQLMTLDGGVFADNKVGVRNFNARTIFKNLEFVVTSDLVRERNPGNCDSRAGLQEKINPGWGEGSILENVTFSGINEGYDCDQKGFEFYHLLGPKRFIGNSFLSGLSAGPGTKQEDVVRIECRWEDDPYNIENILVEDFDGTVGLDSMSRIALQPRPSSQVQNVFSTLEDVLSIAMMSVCAMLKSPRMPAAQIASTIR